MCNKKILFTVLSCLFVFGIFLHSSMNAEISSAESASVVDMLVYSFDVFGFKMTITDTFVRKSAHFLEFFVLGLLLTKTLSYYKKPINKNIIYPLYFGVIIPLTDETIQYFAEGRSPEVKDVLLDYGGFLTGLFIFLILSAAIKQKKFKQISNISK